jgi:hypothetical protein
VAAARSLPEGSRLCAQVELAVRRLSCPSLWGAVVPLPALRAEIARAAPEADRAAVDAALCWLERQWRVDLCVAQSPSTLPAHERVHGIERPGRGFLFYVVLRD